MGSNGMPSGRIGHYEARLETGYSNNDELSEVTDQSDLGRHLDTQGDDGGVIFIGDELNGHPVFRGSGGSQRNYNDDINEVGSEFHLAVLCRSDETADGRVWPFAMHGPNEDGTDEIFAFTENVDDNGYGVFFRDDGDTWQDQVGDTTSDWSLLELSWDGATATFYKDGEFVSDESIGDELDFQTFSLMAFNGGGTLNEEGFEGDVALAVAWGKTLSSNEQTELHQYVLDNYGLQFGDAEPLPMPTADGVDVSSITADGKTVVEVTIDGQVVFVY